MGQHHWMDKAGPPQGRGWRAGWRRGLEHAGSPGSSSSGPSGTHSLQCPPVKAAHSPSWSLTPVALESGTGEPGPCPSHSSSHLTQSHQRAVTWCRLPRCPKLVSLVLDRPQAAERPLLTGDLM